MPFKQAITGILLVFVAGSVGHLLLSGTGDSDTAGGLEGTKEEPVAVGDLQKGVPESTAEKPNRRVIAYYFHGNVRCPTCLAIEEGARQAMLEAFPTAIEAGLLEWQAINTDEVWNAHFVKDFELVSSSVVVAEVSGSATLDWKNLHKVWRLVQEKEAFFEYVQTETRPFLEPL